MIGIILLKQGCGLRKSIVHWDEFPDANVRFEELRQRDVEIVKISQGLQMRTRITKLENELAQLRALEKQWVGNRLSRLYYLVPRKLIGLLRRFTRP